MNLDCMVSFRLFFFLLSFCLRFWDFDAYVPQYWLNMLLDRDCEINSYDELCIALISEILIYTPPQILDWL